jgi:hypothetical protein
MKMGVGKNSSWEEFEQTQTESNSGKFPTTPAIT